MKFLIRNTNKAFAEERGEMVSREDGYGLDVLCVVHLYGHKAYMDKMEQLVQTLFADGLLVFLDQAFACHSQW